MKLQRDSRRTAGGGGVGVGVGVGVDMFRIFFKVGGGLL
jgi:hypothetical protein